MSVFIGAASRRPSRVAGRAAVRNGVEYRNVLGIVVSSPIVGQQSIIMNNYRADWQSSSGDLAQMLAITRARAAVPKRRGRTLSPYRLDGREHRSSANFAIKIHGVNYVLNAMSMTVSVNVNQIGASTVSSMHGSGSNFSL